MRYGRRRRHVDRGGGEKRRHDTKAATRSGRGDAGHGSFAQERARENKDDSERPVGVRRIESVKADKGRGKCVSSELLGDEKKIKKGSEIERNI